MTHGLVFGRFLPYHLGHAHLIRAARARVDRLTVLVRSLPDDPIPGGLRHQWVRAAHPDCRVVHVPGHSDLTPRDVVARFAEPGDVVTSADDDREAAATEAAILADPMRHWDRIAPEARAYFARRVALVGPESVGKSTLAAWLAREYGTAWVPEYGRPYCEGIDALSLTLPDFEAIAWGQATWEDEAAARATRVLLCDTELHTTCTWSDLTVGTRPAWLTAAADARPYALFILLEPDVPWVGDGTRVLPDARALHTRLIRDELARAGRRVVTVRGEWAQRERAVRAAVEAVIAGPPPFR